jgi:hypothetical protein
MSYMAAGASNPNIKNVMSIDYLVGSTDVIATVNQTQLVGRYPNISAAELAVRGILVKCGVKRLDEALFRIPTNIVSRSGADFNSVLTFVNFTTSIAALPPSISCTGSQFRPSDINTPIVVGFRRLSGNPSIELYIKKQVGPIPTNATIDPLLDGYMKIDGDRNIVMQSTEYTRIKAKWVGPVTGFSQSLGTTVLEIFNKEPGFTRTITITAEEL